MYLAVNDTDSLVPVRCGRHRHARLTTFFSYSVLRKHSNYGGNLLSTADFYTSPQTLVPTFLVSFSFPSLCSVVFISLLVSPIFRSLVVALASD